MCPPWSFHLVVRQNGQEEEDEDGGVAGSAAASHSHLQHLHCTLLQRHSLGGGARQGTTLSTLILRLPPLRDMLHQGMELRDIQLKGMLLQAMLLPQGMCSRFVQYIDCLVNLMQ